MVSRTRRGISILTGGRDHLTHRARQRLRTARAVAVALGGAQARDLGARGRGDARRLGGDRRVVARLPRRRRRRDRAARHAQRTAPVRARDAGPHARARSPSARRPGRWPRALAVLALARPGRGLSPFFFGYYDASIWVPVGLALVGVVTAGLIARPPRGSACRRRWRSPASAGLGVWSCSRRCGRTRSSRRWSRATACSCYAARWSVLGARARPQRARAARARRSDRAPARGGGRRGRAADARAIPATCSSAGG